MIGLLILGLLLLAVSGAPLFLVMAGAAMLGYAGQDTPPVAMLDQMFRLAQETSTLVALPLFTFAGYLLAESGAPKRLVQFSQALLGWMPGGLAVVSLVACSVFTAFSGASGVTVIALGGLLLPALRQDHYEEKFSLGLLTTSGSMGLLLPPSLALILYGIVAKTNVDDLFRAGILPCALMVAVLSGYSIWAARGSQRQRLTFSAARLWKAFRAALWEVPIPILILGGIYGGFFTVTDAAAVTAFYVLVIEVGIYRDIHAVRDLPRVCVDSLVLIGSILLILMCALSFTGYLVDQEVPARILDWMKRYLQSPVSFLLMLNLFLLVVGCLLDIFSAIVVVVPLILPLAEQFQVHPVHLGILFLSNLQIGFLTPPVGMGLFLAGSRFEKPILLIFRATLPFLLLLLVSLLLITYVPWFSLVLLAEQAAPAP
ncbi:MAG: TRAP transporter large permease subunit [Planctomycetes bacterium]|nr:TRAP transporter large permease subunit [Planctomycetota bacterium]